MMQKRKRTQETRLEEMEKRVQEEDVSQVFDESQKKQKKQQAESHSVWTCVRDRKLATRVLYPNPVCLLVSSASKDPSALRNAMVLSWLSPVNNKGLFMFSIHRSRQSAVNIIETNRFHLFIPSSVLCSTVLAVGSCSGKDTDKFQNIQGLQWSTVVLQKGAKGKKECQRNVVENTIAELDCNVLQIKGDVEPDHWVVFAQIEQCYVSCDYWNGKHFVAKENHHPPYLTFLGSQRFAFVHPD